MATAMSERRFIPYNEYPRDRATYTKRFRTGLPRSQRRGSYLTLTTTLPFARPVST